MRQLFSDFCNSKSKIIAIFVVTLFVGSGLYCYRLWQPERQVELHQRHFLEAVGDRRWKQIEQFLAPDFRDRFGNTRETVLRDAKEVAKHFFTLTLADSNTAVQFQPGEPQTAVVSTTLRLDGNGTAVAEYVKGAVNSHSSPFTFTWRKKGWQPWAWELTTADHPLLERVGDAF